MGYLSRFQGRPLPYTHTGTIQEIPEISHPRSGIPVQGPAIRFVYSTLEVHRDPKGGETDGHTQVTGLAVELREIRAGAQTRLRFCRLPVRPQV